jgi:hypothetical protein
MQQNNFIIKINRQKESEAVRFGRQNFEKKFWMAMSDKIWQTEFLKKILDDNER